MRKDAPEPTPRLAWPCRRFVNAGSGREPRLKDLNSPTNGFSESRAPRARAVTWHTSPSDATVRASTHRPPLLTGESRAARQRIGVADTLLCTRPCNAREVCRDDGICTHLDAARISFQVHVILGLLKR